MKKALILGISGQDGFYLSSLLAEKGYEVHGVSRRGLSEDVLVVNHVGSILEDVFLESVLKDVVPDEIYHLAGQKQSSEFEEDLKSIPLNVGVTIKILSFLKTNPNSRLFFAGSSEMFGNKGNPPFDENSPFNPISPYAVSKVAAYYLIKIHREKFKTFACTGILFNHESPKREEKYVTRKITQGIAKIKTGLEKELLLGDTSSRRDWGFAGDYVGAMWLMLQSDEPDDYVIGSGESHSVREFAETAFQCAGLDPKKFLREDISISPSSIKNSFSDPSKIERKLGWKREIDFKGLIQMMIKEDLSKI